MVSAIGLRRQDAPHNVANMWREVRDYWLPWLLFAVAMTAAVILILLVVVMPFAVDYVPADIPLLPLFAGDATVRRTSIGGAIGLIVTAFVFFRPGAWARKSS